MSDFSHLSLIDPLLSAVAAEGYTRPTPIQQAAIPPLLAGRDLLGCAQTGTGKTAAFVLPVLQMLAAQPAAPGRRRIRALILSPTRELAAQIDERVGAYGRELKIRHTVIFGGVGQASQIDQLRRGLDVLVACPGRLLDLHGQGHVDLSAVTHFVLDEADRMLDMGFVHDVRKVLRLLPPSRQNLLFSATMPAAIVKLADSFLQDPVHVEVTPQSSTVERIDQQVRFVAKADKRAALLALLQTLDFDRVLVFSRTKHGANRLVTVLEKAGLRAAALHGNKSQSARERALNGFTDGSIPILVATDVAARGLDVDGVSHVVNFDLPNEPEVYVHRIGRTGRAGASGQAIAFCEPDDGAYLRQIERVIEMEIPVERAHSFHEASAEPPPAQQRGRGAARAPSGRRGQGGRGAQRVAEAPRSVPAPRVAEASRVAEAPRVAEVPRVSEAEAGESAADRLRRRRRRSQGAGQAAEGGQATSAPQPSAFAEARAPAEGAAEGAPRRRRRRRRSPALAE